MARTLAASVALAALGLTAGAVSAAPDPHRFAVAHEVSVHLPPGSCISAGGRVDRAHGRDRCVLPLVVFEPPDPCLRDHGVMVETGGGRRGCALRDPQSGLPTGQRQH